MEDINKENINFLNWKQKIILFLTSQTISLFGSAIVQFAIIWHITLTTKSGIMMTVATLCGFLPQLAISLFAGVWADRYYRKKLIIYSDFLIASSTLALAILFMSGYDHLWLLFLVSGIRSLGAGIQTPAVNALIPQIVPTDKLIKVNGINGSVQSMILLLSPAVSGAILAKVSLTATFFVDVVTATIAIVILVFLKIPLHEKATQVAKTKVFADLIEGLNYIKNSKFLKSFFLFLSIMIFLITPIALLTPLLVTRSFGEDIWFLTLNEMAYFTGSVIGGIIISIWGGFKNRIKSIAIACSLSGILSILLGLSSIFIVYLIVIFISGLVVPLLNAPAISLLQERINSNIQGRIFSIVQIITSAVMPLGMVIFGPLADIVKIEFLIIITGVIMMFMGLIIIKNNNLKLEI